MSCPDDTANAAPRSVQGPTRVSAGTTGEGVT